MSLMLADLLLRFAERTFAWSTSGILFPESAPTSLESLIYLTRVCFGWTGQAAAC